MPHFGHVWFRTCSCEQSRVLFKSSLKKRATIITFLIFIPFYNCYEFFCHFFCQLINSKLPVFNIFDHFCRGGLRAASLKALLYHGNACELLGLLSFIPLHSVGLQHMNCGLVTLWIVFRKCQQTFLRAQTNLAVQKLHIIEYSFSFQFQACRSLSTNIYNVTRGKKGGSEKCVNYWPSFNFINVKRARFFVRICFSSYMYVEKAAETTFVRKRHT